MHCCKSRRRRELRNPPLNRTKKPSDFPEGLRSATSLFQVLFSPVALIAIVPRLIDVVDQIVERTEGEAARQPIARQRIVRESENVVHRCAIKAGARVLEF